MFELELKDKIVSFLTNPILVGLIKDKKYIIDNKTFIELEGDFNFSLSFVNDKLVITVHNIKPKITTKRFFKFQGRISTITISSVNIVIGIDGLPDVTLDLV